MELLDYACTGVRTAVYGAGLWGGIVTKCLKTAGVEPYCYVTTDGGAELLGKKVISLEKLDELYRELDGNLAVIIAVWGDCGAVYEALKKTQIERAYYCETLFKNTDPQAAGMTEKEREAFKSWESFCVNTRKTFGHIFLNSIDLVLTERCSLRCRNCANLMQYYKNPSDIDTEDNIMALDSLMTYVDALNELRIIGGEPFMCKGWEKIIERYRKNPKINDIVIYSNATIVPAQSMLDAIRENDVQMYFSYYGELSGRMNEWISWCTDNAVRYIVMQADEWWDLGDLHKRNRSAEEVADVYEKCNCRCLTLLRGKLSVCPYSAHAAYLGAMTQKEAETDALDVTEIGCRERLSDFLYKREYLEACDYCDGRCRATTKPHIQAKEVLEYVHD